VRLRADQKLFLTYLVLIAAVVVVLTLGVGATLRRQLTDMLVADLRRELFLARAVYHAAPPADDAGAARMVEQLSVISGRRVTIVAADGAVVGDSELRPGDAGYVANLSGYPEVRDAQAGVVGRETRAAGLEGVDHLFMAVATEDGRVIRMGVPLRETVRAIRAVQRGIFGVGAVALALTGLLSLGFSIAVTRPLRQLVSVARAMAAGDLSLRARTRHRDEVGELGDALDILAGELRRRLGQLEGERAEMQALIDSMAEAVLAVDARGRIARANPTARRIFGLPADPRGLSPQEVARRTGFLELVRRTLGGEAIAPTELNHDGRALLATAQPLPGGGAVLVFLDVSQLRRLEDVRRDFVANASHELKTPLTAIRGYSETLLNDDLPPPLRRQFAGTVKANADRLQRIVDDLLDLSRIESGGWRVEPEIVSLREIADEAWSTVAEAASRKQVRLDVDVPPEAEFVDADPSALRQVLCNLFGNAIRYVPEHGGRVTVTARPVHDRAEVSADPYSPRERVAVAVADNGTGILSVHLPRIFERFYRVDAARSREEGGTGLGLAIVRHLVEAHGGGIEAESEPGCGTVIRFDLPAPDAGETSSP
jgi:two-component system, OmpR family, phosphate regulon sensor histidine kinase PhoR